MGIFVSLHTGPEKLSVVQRTQTQPCLLHSSLPGAGVLTVNSEPWLRHDSVPHGWEEDVGDVSYRNLSRSKRDDWQEGCLRRGEHSCDISRTWNMIRQRFTQKR